MYDVKFINDSDQGVLYDIDDDELLMSYAKISEGINKTGSFTFSLPVTNKNGGAIRSLHSEIVVDDIDGAEIYRGRSMGSEPDMYNTTTYTCEGVMAYLLDTKYPPYVHTGGVEKFLKDLLDYHNSRVTDKQKIFLGIVTVKDPNDYLRRESESFNSVLNIIQEKLISSYGGLLRMRRVDDKNYLDYLAEYPISDQTARIGENIVDLTRCVDASTVRTVIIPLGAKDEESGKYLDITSVNGGKNYLVDETLVKLYGWIEDTVEFEDVTLPENLLKKGQEYLKQCQNFTMTIELSMVDCRLLGMDTGRLTPGMQVKVEADFHELDEYFLCTSKETDLLNPANDKIVLGNQIRTFTETVHREQKENENKIEVVRSSLSDEIKKSRDEFKDALDNASGLYNTEIKQDDGSTVIYYHDKKNMKDSQILMIFNTAGFGISSDGGQNWYGMQVNGDMIANILNATGINAEWIRTGKAYSVNYKPEQSGMVIDFDHGFIERFFNGVATRLISGALMITDKDIQVSYGPMGMTIEETGKYSVEANANGFFIYDISASKYILEIRFDHASKKITDFAVNGKSGKSGRAEFSDGSYLEFEQGILVGGRTADGTSV